MTVYLCTHQTRKSVDKTSLAYNLYQIAECLDGHRSLEEEISYVMSGDFILKYAGPLFFFLLISFVDSFLLNY